jgi:hypothetical protein
MGMSVGMTVAATKEEGATRIALLLVVMLASLTLLVRSEKCRAHDVTVAYDGAEPDKTIAADGVALWLKARFSEADLEAFQPGDLKAESYYCGCYDRPNKHYPYSIVLLKTPKGDLVTRPEGTDGALIFTALAVRHGNRYCQVESETDCYGSFAHPCEFTDFKYGPSLAEFFPTCKSD